MMCSHCHQPLKRAQWNAAETLKSCPKCSQDNGAEHVFYSYPEAFGITDKRASEVHPEGPQSYCYSCRSATFPYPASLCHDVL
jgi:hypothetical protein